MPNLPILKKSSLLIVAAEELWVLEERMLELVQKLKSAGVFPIYYVSPEYVWGKSRKRLAKIADEYLPLKRNNISNLQNIFHSIPAGRDTLFVFGAQLGECINSVLKLAEFPPQIRRVIFPTGLVDGFQKKTYENYLSESKEKMEKLGISVELIDLNEYTFAREFNL